MTLKELLIFLNDKTPYPYWDAGNEIFAQVKAQTCSNSLVCAVIAAIMQHCQCQDGDCVVVRENVVKALSAMRLKYMADDAPVDGFRLVEGTVIAIDAAFNDEALRNKQ